MTLYIQLQDIARRQLGELFMQANDMPTWVRTLAEFAFVERWYPTLVEAEAIRKAWRMLYHPDGEGFIPPETDGVEIDLHLSQKSLG